MNYIQYTNMNGFFQPIHPVKKVNEFEIGMVHNE